MKRRTMGLGLLGAMTLMASSLGTACGSEPAAAPELGTLSLPLSTHGPSGVEYRLRDAVFQISSDGYYDGAGGYPSTVTTVSSEDDPTATSISVSVERGYKMVRLLPGWHLEKVEPGGATVVESTLLSGETQWVYVSPRSSSWVEYKFGIGERSIWFNGQLKIGVEVYEKPSQYYGGGGEGGELSGVSGASGGGG